MEKLIEKINFLDEYLQNKYHLTLWMAIDVEENKIKDIQENKISKDQIDPKLLKEIADFFFLDTKFLLDDTIELPHEDDLDVDEIIITKRQGEYKNLIGTKKRKNVIKRNYKLLDKKSKKKLFINLAITMLPFLAFIIYAVATVSYDVSDTYKEYKDGNHLSESQQKIEDSLPGLDKVTYANINVGATIESIDTISASNQSFNVSMQLRYDFDQYEYHKMYYKLYKDGEDFNSKGEFSEEELKQDSWCFDSTGEGWLNYPDSIPDCIQFNFPGNDLSQKPTSISTIYTNEIAAYPGEKSSNVFTDKNDEFSMGNGKISADSLEYLNKGEAYIDSKGNFRYFQKLHFSASINKTFDNPRYPLDSAQFHIYIQPHRSTDYVRYVPDLEMSGFATYFRITDQYKLIKETEDLKNLTIINNYYALEDQDKSSSTFGETIYLSQLEIVVRANKTGIAIFFNSFLNIIAVAIWLILAFFNQSFNKEDSIGMIGTGFFSAISAILLGFSLVSNANFFSILSIINIFTLGMVLIMGYESITSNKFKNLNDATSIAYKTVKMRILFYFLVACSVVMYILLPCISYMWLL